MKMNKTNEIELLNASLRANDKFINDLKQKIANLERRIDDLTKQEQRSYGRALDARMLCHSLIDMALASKDEDRR